MCTLRSADFEGKVGPADAHARFHVFVADVDPTEKSNLVVDEQYLAMIPSDSTDEQGQEAIINVNLAACCAQGRRDGESPSRGAPTVNEDPHRQTSGGRVCQRLDKTSAHPGRGEGVYLQMYAPFRPFNGLKHSGIGLITTVEQCHRLRRGGHWSLPGGYNARCGIWC